jgi:hypothetical protein
MKERFKSRVVKPGSRAKKLERRQHCQFKKERGNCKKNTVLEIRD